MEPDTFVFLAVFRNDFGSDTVQGAGNIAHADDNGSADLAVPEHQRGGVQFVQGSIRLLLVEFAFFRQTDIPAGFFKELYTAQFVFQIVDGAAEGGLGDAQPGGGNGIVLHLGQDGKITQDIIVHRWCSFNHSFIL